MSFIYYGLLLRMIVYLHFGGVSKVGKTYHLYQDQFHEEEETGFSCRWLPYAGQILLPGKSAGACVNATTNKLPSLVWPSDYYPLLLSHVGGEEDVTCSPRVIKRDFRALGLLVRGSGAQVIYSSLLLLAVALEETVGPSLLIHDSVCGVTTTVVVFLTMGWSTRHQTCWCQLEFTFYKEWRRSLLRILWGSLTGL